MSSDFHHYTREELRGEFFPAPEDAARPRRTRLCPASKYSAVIRPYPATSAVAWLKAATGK